MVLPIKGASLVAQRDEMCDFPHVTQLLTFCGCPRAPFHDPLILSEGNSQTNSEPAQDNQTSKSGA
jgi:hypothetical protein